MSGLTLEAARALEVEAIHAHQAALDAEHEACDVKSEAYAAWFVAKLARERADTALHNARCRVRAIVLEGGTP